MNVKRVDRLVENEIVGKKEVLCSEEGEYKRTSQKPHTIGDFLTKHLENTVLVAKRWEEEIEKATLDSQ